MTVLFPLTASADTGPKPSVVIDFNGLEGKTYYATLLSSVESTGPFSALNDNNNYAHYNKGDYPPKVFKILLYFPETDSFIVSDTMYERYAFDSYFTAKVDGTKLSAEKSYDYTGEALSLIVRIVITIIAELAIALLFGFRERKQIRFITLVNIITQVALNLALNIINYRSSVMTFIIFYFILEVAVVITEAILYNWYLKKNSLKEVPKWKPSAYALTSNFISFALGIALAFWIPEIF